MNWEKAFKKPFDDENNRGEKSKTEKTSYRLATSLLNSFSPRKKHVGQLYHPVNKYPVDIYKGFSWPCLFFGFFWYLYKGMFLWAIINFLVAGFTFGISLLVFPFFSNKQHIDYLKKQGYLSEIQLNDIKRQ